MYDDPEGNSVLFAVLVGIAIGSLTVYVPDVVENVKKDGFQLSDFLTINKNNYKEYLAKTIVGGLTGYIGALGLNAFFSAPLVGVLNTLSELISGNIHSYEELLIIFSISTMISFLTLGTCKFQLKNVCIPMQTL